MNNVFPEDLNRLTGDDTKDIKILEDYIRYMCERTDFTIAHLTNGMTEAQLIDLIHENSLSVADVINLIHNNIKIPVNPSDTSNINIWIVD